MEEGTLGPLLHAKFHPHRCNVSPLRGEKPQNWSLSKLNTGKFALRAMLPVITLINSMFFGCTTVISMHLDDSTEVHALLILSLRLSPLAKW